jgi:hypothetical protein
LYFSFSTVWCYSYFQLSTVLPNSIFDTFIGHRQTWLGRETSGC